MIKEGGEVWCIDFEASSLDLKYSYPIEVGYYNGKIEKEFLIRPCAWWHDWSEESAAIHGLEQFTLMTKGIHPEIVAEEMNKDLKNAKVWCDGSMFDQYWNFTLFDAVDMKPDFLICHFQPIGMEKEFVEHRALSDAKQLWNFIRKLGKEEGITILNG